MARPLRIEYPGAYYHVMNRGLSRRDIFLEDQGRRVGKRAIDILSPLGRPVLPDAREVPVLGRIRAGAPLLAEENIEGFLTVAPDPSFSQLV